MINIAADFQIPEIKSRLDDLLDTKYSLKFFDSSTVSAFDLKNIDALFVRSTLSVNRALCEGTGVSFIASATAGVNHLDIDFLESEHIAWSYAPGCNAYSVIHYVLAAIGELIKDKLFQQNQSIGVLGYGNIGKRLYKILKALNFDVYACDPFISKSELIDALKKLKNSNKKVSELNLIKYLHTSNIPDPDFLIRTGNTKRLSNFLLWQLAYTEIFFVKKLWPDFNEKDYTIILKKFKNVKRNFGNI